MVEVHEDFHFFKSLHLYINIEIVETLIGGLHFMNVYVLILSLKNLVSHYEFHSIYEDNNFDQKIGYSSKIEAE